VEELEILFLLAEVHVFRKAFGVDPGVDGDADEILQFLVVEFGEKRLEGVDAAQPGFDPAGFCNRLKFEKGVDERAGRSIRLLVKSQRFICGVLSRAVSKSSFNFSQTCLTSWTWPLQAP
jgi:hypothetical protein